MKPITRYRINIGWSDEDACFVAKVPALPGVVADGDTVEEAAREINIALEAALETLESNGFPLPEADMALEELRRFRGVINLSALARKSGVNKHSLATKLRRGTRFTDEEARRIRGVLTEL